MATKTQTRTKNSGTNGRSTTSRNATVSKTSASSRTASRSNSKNEDMPTSKFHKLFMEELKDIYWAEKNLVKALGKMQKAATSEELANAIVEHQEQTKEHVARVEQIFEQMGMTPKAKKCEAMEGLIAEGQEVIEDTDEDSAVRDAGIIICAQKIEHYEIAAYGSLRTLASKMGHEDAVQILQMTLDEEKETDSLLTQIAESSVNEEAATE